ncbi:type I secretion system permease/ATPase [Stenotrophomonas sp. SAU14A_NAIMI4_8]|uniref:type I secretion system permease/ATPase n=1 Tax=Stenotrophomonas sp. SAU14A_NAIMI4_8 TaxID=2072409 RepID=UPI000D540D0B|nr:type I secretion system permease/ATPase [Stenotrophomonas sp. SAU14A_NAIMI4_8]AWH33927.1 type I secretion system permease/ATPase [Stenotrophomonas sp. SAU14A_NAIMI4_8]
MNVSNSAPASSEYVEAIQGADRIDDTLLDSVSWICSHHGQHRSAEALLAGLPKAGRLTPSLALAALEQAGLIGGIIQRPLARLFDSLAPFILLRKDHGGMVYLGRQGQDEQLRYRVVLPDSGCQAVELDAAEMASLYSGYAILVKPRARVDARAGAEAPQASGHWLRSTLWHYRRYYLSAALGALLINVLALATIFFTMNVYDRVVPNLAYVTLWSLAIGVSVALVFEAIARYARAHLLDMAGKKADLVMGSILFRQAMSIRMEHKPASAGSFANQLREFESVRDFVTSATLSVISDLPFVILFAALIFAIGGPLGWIPLLVIPLILLVSIVAQWPLARTMQENLREASLKQGVLIESVEGLETLKAVAGEGFMQRRWERFSGMAADTSMKSRQLSTLAINLVTSLQQLQTVALVVYGVYLIGEGLITQGSLIAAVMLAGRVTAPLGQVTGLAVRFQQTKAALVSLNKLMEMPTDRGSAQDYIACPQLSGQLTLRGIGFSYPQQGMQSSPLVLQGIDINIGAGEKLAILGRIGSGKSTLLRIMARLFQPVQGQLLSDGIDVTQIDPADWRRAVGYVGQDARLFYGSLRENVMIGRPDASPEQLLRVLRLCGLDVVASRHPMGINLPIGEGGQGLSGGQRQLVALARTLLSRPRLLLLDEPTSAMDAQTEARFLQHLHRAVQGQTLVVVTHRPSLLKLVDRVVIVEDGSVAADGRKETILARFRGKHGSLEDTA